MTLTLVLLLAIAAMMAALLARTFLRKPDNATDTPALDGLKEENTKLREELRGLARMLDQEKETAAARLHEARTETAQVRRDLDETRDRLQQELRGKTSDLAALAANLKAAEGQRDRYYTELETAKSLLKAEERTRSELSIALEKAENKHRFSEETCQELKGSITRLSDSLEKQAADLRAATGECSKLSAQNEQLKKQLETQEEQLKALGESIRVQFQNVANDLLKNHSQDFKAKSQEELAVLLKPFQEKLESFNKEVKESRDESLKDRQSLYEQIKMIRELNTRLHEETSNLTKALKGEAKVQGDWGETILQTLLERSGLERNQQFRTQVQHTGPGGNTLITDVEMYLPGSRTVVIDSKVSITAYQDFVSATDEATRRTRLSDHQRSIKAHIDTLASKEYFSLVEGIEFVIMFVPVEPALQTALQSDENLWQYAYHKKVILMGPNGLIPCLKLVHDLWRQDKLSRNGEQLAKFGEILYGKLVGVVEDLQAAIKQIDKAGEASRKAMDKLSTGNGSATITAQKMVRLGLKAKKALPDNVVGNLVDVDLEDVPAILASGQEED